MVIRQKRIVLVIKKTQTGNIEKNIKYQSSVFMNVMDNAMPIELLIGNSYKLNNEKHTSH